MSTPDFYGHAREYAAELAASVPRRIEQGIASDYEVALLSEVEGLRSYVVQVCKRLFKYESPIPASCACKGCGPHVNEMGPFLCLACSGGFHRGAPVAEVIPCAVAYCSAVATEPGGYCPRHSAPDTETSGGGR